jgi:hypothetical protein
VKISAYVMAADPAWIEASVCSFYRLVDHIVVSYDTDGRSWAGRPIPTDECLQRLHAIDHEQKMIFAPGHYSRPESPALESETLQRQAALDQASAGVDWVLQLDTDEVLAEPEMFMKCLRDAHAHGYDGLHYPARNLYQYLGGDRYLEICGRFWGPQAAYPGPVAVRAGTRLELCRQAEASVRTYRVDFRRRNTDPWRPRDTRIDRTIPPPAGILHFTRVRSDEYMERKARWSGHADEGGWDYALRRWRWARRHPYLATLITPVQHRLSVKRLRISRVAVPGNRREPSVTG